MKNCIKFVAFILIVAVACGGFSGFVITPLLGKVVGLYTSLVVFPIIGMVAGIYGMNRWILNEQ
jgi:uncharacterized membrane protein (DUF4010 family)